MPKATRRAAKKLLGKMEQALDKAERRGLDPDATGGEFDCLRRRFLGSLRGKTVMRDSIIYRRSVAMFNHRARLTGGRTFFEVLSGVIEAQLDAFVRDLPPEKLVELARATGVIESVVDGARKLQLAKGTDNGDCQDETLPTQAGEPTVR